MTQLKISVNDTQLFHDLKAMGRENFSYEGAQALMQYLEQLQDDCEISIEYDPIAFCCEYTEYADLEDFNECYNPADPFENWEEVGENTHAVIHFDGGTIVADF